MVITPSTAAPEATVVISGKVLRKKQTRIFVNGILVASVASGTNGTLVGQFGTAGNGQFSRSVVVPADLDDGVYPVTVEQYTGTAGSWSAQATANLTVQAPDSAEWTLVFEDNFATWVPANYFVYPLGWHDTKGTGTYDPSIISSDGSKLRINLHYDGGTGTRRVAAFCPLPTGSLSARGDLLGMKVEFRIRADDTMIGYKGVPLLWPQSGNGPYTANMVDGELDIYESDFNVLPKAFTHHQGGTVGNDQDYFLTPSGTSWNDWHVIRCEWIAGVSASYFIDDTPYDEGVPYTPGTDPLTTRIPSTPMHLVMQFETTIEGTLAGTGVSGYVEIDYLKVWSPA